MPSDLSPSEKEERQVERLLNKEQAPSRKRKRSEKRGPKHDNRRRRMNIEDPDLESSDPDMSLNRNTQGTIVFAALRIAADISEELNDALVKFESQLRDVAPSIADSFVEYANSYYRNWVEEGWSDDSSMAKEASEILQMTKVLPTIKKNVSHDIRRGDPDVIVDTIVKYWPDEMNSGWAEKAGIIAALDAAIDKIPIPNAYKTPFLSGNPAEAFKDKKLIRKLIESAGKTYSMRNVEEEAILYFAQLVAAYRLLENNPSSINKSSLRSGIDELAKELEVQAEEISQLGAIFEAWNDTTKGIKVPDQAKAPETAADYNRVLKDLDNFFGRQSIVDPSLVMSEIRDYTESKFDDISPELEGVFEGMDRAAASYGTPTIRTMASKVATFHGIRDTRGNPVQTTNTGYKSFHSRNFTEDNYKAIIKYAEALLDQPWLKYNWDGSTKDSQLRAALDMAIHMADDNLYQAKIDTETYNLLYNRLAKTKTDTFSETLIPVHDKIGTRSAAAMKQTQEYRKIVRIASDLRNSDPKAAFEILKNMRALASTNADPVDTISSHIALEETEAEPATSTDMFSAGGHGDEYDGEQDLGLDAETASGSDEEISFKSMNDDDFTALKKELKSEVNKLFDEDDVEAFMKGFDEIIKEVETKTAAVLGSGVSLREIIKLAASSPEAKKLLGPVILAAAKKRKKTTKKSKKKDDSKDDSKGDELPEAFKKNQGKKGKKKSKGKKKRKSNLAFSDINW